MKNFTCKCAHCLNDLGKVFCLLGSSLPAYAVAEMYFYLIESKIHILEGSIHQWLTSKGIFKVYIWIPALNELKVKCWTNFLAVTCWMTELRTFWSLSPFLSKHLAWGRHLTWNKDSSPLTTSPEADIKMHILIWNWTYKWVKLLMLTAFKIKGV